MRLTYGLNGSANISNHLLSVVDVTLLMLKGNSADQCYVHPSLIVTTVERSHH